MGLSEFSQRWGFGFHVGFYFGDVGVYFLGYSVFMLMFACRVKPAPGKTVFDSPLALGCGSNRLSLAAAVAAGSRLLKGCRDTLTRGAGRVLAMVIMVFHVISPMVTASPGPSPASVDPEVEELSVVELAREMNSGRLTSEKVVQGYLARIEAIDRNGPALRSVISTMPEALAEARQLDAERAAGVRRGPMHGIPILVKDNIEAAGPVPTTAGSTALLANVTGRDAPVVARLKAAGALILGKTNLSQWANIRSNHSTSGWSSVGGLTRNPYALDRNCCGSSSGSGAATAASLAAAAIGTETDGSIICPSATNGVVGFKPTLGLVSRTGIIPISESQDTAGPMTRTVEDAALLLTAMVGSEAADPSTAEADARRTEYASGLTGDFLRGVRVGVLRDRVGSDERVAEVFSVALRDLESGGAELVEISDSHSGLEELGSAEHAVLMTELKAGLNAYLATTPPAVKTRTLSDLITFNRAHAERELRWFQQELFELGESQNGLDDPAYRQALQTSRQLAGPEGIDRLLATHNVRFLVGPSNGPAWPSDLLRGDAYSGPSQSQLPAVAGYPHLTVPMGFVDGLPVGLSFIGPKWADHDVLKAGYAYEMKSQKRQPPAYRAPSPSRSEK